MNTVKLGALIVATTVALAGCGSSGSSKVENSSTLEKTTSTSVTTIVKPGDSTISDKAIDTTNKDTTAPTTVSTEPTVSTASTEVAEPTEPTVTDSTISPIPEISGDFTVTSQNSLGAQVTNRSIVPTESAAAINTIDVDINGVTKTLVLDNRSPDELIVGTADANYYFYAHQDNDPNASYEKRAYTYYENVYFGIVSNDASNSFTSYAQGQITPVSEVPQTGVVNYAGTAMMSTRKDLTYADFAVDFANKTVNGQIGSAALIKGTISGNSFSGTASEGTYSVGRFFGPNAAELGGTFVNAEKNITGAFGAASEVQ